MTDRAGAATLTEAYEALRSFVVGPRTATVPPRGLVFLLRQGMPGWIEAWAGLGPPGSDDGLGVAKTEAGMPNPQGVVIGYAAPLQAEAAAILARMVLAAIGR